jgi:hypothetical protein
LGKSKYKNTRELKEAIRERARIFARKKYRKDPKESYKKYKEYWANTLGRRKDTRRIVKSQNTREWRRKFPNKTIEYHLRNKLKWTNGVNCLDRTIWERAERVAVGFIKNRKFSDVMLAPFKQFLYDVLAKKDDKICCFQVTTLRTRLIKRRHIELAKYFGWRYFIVHVKPTFTEIYIKEIDLNQNLRNKNGVQFNCCKSERCLINGRQFP